MCRTRWALDQAGNLGVGPTESHVKLDLICVIVGV